MFNSCIPRLSIPRTTLVILCGAAGSGKSTFARSHFPETAVVSSDLCRAMAADDEAALFATPHAFTIFHTIIEQRLRLGRLTVADSTALNPRARRHLLQLARRYDFYAYLIIFHLPEKLCLEQNRRRSRVVPERVISAHCQMVEKVIKSAPREGFDNITVLTPQDLSACQVEITPLPVEKYRQDKGPFDIIGDVHGCRNELVKLLQRLGYNINAAGVYYHPFGRKAVFLGDLSDRGPFCLDTVNLAWRMIKAGTALYVPGNHCKKLAGYLEGRRVQIAHGLEKTVAELQNLTPSEYEDFRRRFLELFSSSPPYLILDEGRLVVSHGGIREHMIGRLSPRIISFCFYGDPTGKVDPETGLPIRRDWAQHYRGRALVVYGHTPVEEVVFRHNTVNIDTGCVMGGKLTALRYPEREIVQVPAETVYYRK